MYGRRKERSGLRPFIIYSIRWPPVSYFSLAKVLSEGESYFSPQFSSASCYIAGRLVIIGVVHCCLSLACASVVSESASLPLSCLVVFSLEMSCVRHLYATPSPGATARQDCGSDCGHCRRGQGERAGLHKVGGRSHVGLAAMQLLRCVLTVRRWFWFGFCRRHCCVRDGAFAMCMILFGIAPPRTDSFYRICRYRCTAPEKVLSA